MGNVVDGDQSWKTFGKPEQEGALHPSTRVFSIHESNPDNPEAVRFMIHLENAVSYRVACNLKKRYTDSYT